MRDLHPADKIHHKYNDQVMFKWVLSIFIHNRRTEGLMTLTLDMANAMNWALLHECLKQEQEEFQEGNRVSILDLMADVLPDTITLDLVLNWWNLNSTVLTEAAQRYTGDYEIVQAMRRLARNRLNTYELVAAVPDWFN